MNKNTFKKFLEEVDPLDHFQISQFLKRVLKLDDDVVSPIADWLLDTSVEINSRSFSELINAFTPVLGDPWNGSAEWGSLGANTRRKLFDLAKEKRYW